MSLPKNHWIHAALNKETKRLSKKAAVPDQKEAAKEAKMGEQMGSVPGKMMHGVKAGA